MPKSRNLTLFLNQAKELQRKYCWMDAIKLYEEASETAVKLNDFSKAAEIFESIGFCCHQAAMQAEEGHMLLVEFGKQAAEFMAMKNMEVFAEPQAIGFMVFDDLNPDSPFYDQRVREAVDYALDRDWLAENLGYGMAEPV